mgnify:CR=1 FL=1
MYQLTQEQVDEFKKIYKEAHGKELTDEEAWEGARSLATLAEIALDAYVEDTQRKQRLKKEQNGYHLDDGKTYTCCVCHDSISGEKTWYDKSGIKCMLCQKAINRRIIPRSVCTDSNSWVPAWMITRDLGIHSSTIQKYIRTGELRVRNIMNDDGKIHYQVFLLKENQEFLKKHQPQK